MQLSKAVVALALSSSICIAAMPVGDAPPSLLAKRTIPKVLGLHGCPGCKSEFLSGESLAPEKHEVLQPTKLRDSTELVTPPFDSHGGLAVPKILDRQGAALQDLRDLARARHEEYDLVLHDGESAHWHRKQAFKSARDGHKAVHEATGWFAEHHLHEAQAVVDRADHNLALAPHDPRQWEWKLDKAMAKHSIPGYQSAASLHYQRAKELGAAKYPDHKAILERYN